MADPTFGASAFNGTPGSAPILSNLNRKLNNRSIPPEMQAIKDLSDKTKLYIFNVGPWQHTQFMGSLGRKIIPACPEGKAYSDPLIVDGIVSELYPDSESSMKREMYEGEKVAHEILNEGPFHLKHNSLRQYGVSICHQWPPTKEEISAAWKSLAEGELEALIRQANSAYSAGPQEFERTIGNGERYFLAAKLLKKTTAECPWMMRTINAGSSNVECRFCGEAMKPNLAKCPNCKEVVDQELYAKLTAKK